MYQNILVPIDGSATGALGLREAIDLARALAGGSASCMSSTRRRGSAAMCRRRLIEELITQLRSTGECIVHEATRTANAADIEVDTRIIEAPGERAGEIVVAEADPGRHS